MPNMIDLDELVDLATVASEHNISLDRLNTWKFRYPEHVPDARKMFARGPLYLRNDWEGFFKFVHERGLWTPDAE